MPTRAPFQFWGGKQYLVGRLVKLIPPHRIYVEVFGGAAALLFAKQPSELEIYNDIDSNIVNFFRVLRDEAKVQRLVHLLRLTPYSREEFYFCRDNLNEPDIDDVERARRFFVVVQQSFSGNMQTWGPSRTKKVAHNYFNNIDRLIHFSQRLRNVIVEHKDFEELIKQYDTPETFFYCDPPYLGANYFGHVMTEHDHERLIRTLLSIRGKAMVSHYPHPLYDQLLKLGWKKITFRRPLYYKQNIGGTRRYVRECVYFNYEPPKRRE